MLVNDSSSGYSTADTSSFIRGRPTTHHKSSKGLHQLLDRFRNFVRIRRYRSADRKLKHMKQTNYYRVQSWLEKNCVQTADDQLTILSGMTTFKQSSYLTRTPRRSSSMVGRDFSPASSLSSLILSPTRKAPANDKSNRRRIIDFNRRRTVTGPMETISSNKENLSNSNRPSDIYRFDQSIKNGDSSPKKYFFYSNNSGEYQHRTLPTGKYRRNSFTPMINMFQVPTSFGHLDSKPDGCRMSQVHSESLEDLLCDKEVESYFYPTKTNLKNRPPDDVYMNLKTANDYYKSSELLQGTLC